MRKYLALLALCLLALLPAAASGQAVCTKAPTGYVCTFPPDTLIRRDTVHVTDTLRLYCVLAGTWACSPAKPTDPAPPPTDTVVAPPDTVTPPPVDTATPPPPPPPTGTNEPAGGTVVADNDWSGFSTAEPALGKSRYGWNRYAAGNTGRWVSDPTAPDDPDVLEILKSGTQGTGPEHLSLTLPKGARQLYIRVPVYVPSNYLGPTGGVQKLFHLWAPFDKGTNGSLGVPAIFGSGTGALRTQIRIQNATVTSTQGTSFNLEGRPFQRGRWYVTEWLFVMNAPGQANGEAWLWQDGALALSRKGITYSKAGCATAPGPCSGWTVVQLNPTYGGTGSTPAPPQRLRYGRIRVVVAP